MSKRSQLRHELYDPDAAQRVRDQRYLAACERQVEHQQEWEREKAERKRRREQSQE